MTNALDRARAEPRMPARRPQLRRPRGAAQATDADAAEPIRYGPLADWVGFRLRMAQVASFQAFAREAATIDVRPGRFAVLMLIGENPGISQTALSRANGRDKSTLTPVLEDLVRRNLVSRTRMAHDRRAYRLALTPAGAQMLRELTECARRHEKNLDRVIGKRDRAAFLRVLRKLAAELAAPTPGLRRSPQGSAAP